MMCGENDSRDRKRASLDLLSNEKVPGLGQSIFRRISANFLSLLFLFQLSKIRDYYFSYVKKRANISSSLTFLFYIYLRYDWYQNDKIVTISIYTKKKVCLVLQKG